MKSSAGIHFKNGRYFKPVIPLSDKVDFFLTSNLNRNWNVQTQDGIDYNGSPISAGEILSIRVKINGTTDLESTQTMPDSIKIIEASLKQANTSIGSDFDKPDIVKIKIKDNPNEKNYYGFNVLYIVEENGSIDTLMNSIGSSDPAFDIDFSSFALFKDELFNGKEYTLSLEVFPSRWGSTQNVVGLIIEAHHFSRDAYLYLSSLARSYYSDGNPFAEPIIVHQNIKNGYGIFGLANVNKYYQKI
ncbi:MAG: DUF4249 family protein [Saprospiraceae bacterium]|nr:DUF4249 family protein [Candidatus Defluviibacterium haderslevense]